MHLLKNARFNEVTYLNIMLLLLDGFNHLYFEGQLTQLSEVETEETPQVNVTEAAEKVSLQEENIKPRSDLPPLLVPLRERRPERLHYLGVSFGLTLDLFRFWRKHKFAPFFIGNAPNSVTGEYTCMVLKALKNDDVEDAGSDEWGFYEYKGKLVELLGSTYRKMNYKLAMSVFDPKINFVEQDPASSASSEILGPYEMNRLEAYSNSRIDYPLASLLLCYGLQHKDIPDIEDEMKAKTTEGSLDPELCQQYVVDKGVDFENALQNGGGKIGVVSIKSNKSKLEKRSKPETENIDKKRHKSNSGSKSHKKRKS
ncbi:hypothetical protein K7X08_002970 [Anisodus acutangulus]|uniref:Uncharacterized protein n=1 Tax=Anisodus acutangulus TaxID=402998 RepID=A0A9Q1MCS0_9SOLA|nr:hypothetical protein K7X08_002970 [Anisodus acutangulus]